MDEKMLKSMMDSMKKELIEQMKSDKKELKEEIKSSTAEIKDEVKEVKENVTKNTTEIEAMKSRIDKIETKLYSEVLQTPPPKDITKERNKCVANGSKSENKTEVNAVLSLARKKME